LAIDERDIDMLRRSLLTAFQTLALISLVRRVGFRRGRRLLTLAAAGYTVTERRLVSGTYEVSDTSLASRDGQVLLDLLGHVQEPGLVEQRG